MNPLRECWRAAANSNAAGQLALVLLFAEIPLFAAVVLLRLLAP